MSFTCSIVEDMLPLYLEDMCSEDSRAAVERHLQGCQACREKLARMKDNRLIPKIREQEDQIPVADYAKKVRRHRLRLGISVAVVSAVAVCFLTLCLLTAIDMHRQANPLVFFAEAGVCDLTAEELETTAAELDGYVFYTNTQRIQVSIPKDAGYESEIVLWDVTDRDDPSQIGYGRVEPGNTVCTFGGLSADRRYMLTCDGGEAALTVNDGRIVDFWYSMGNVLRELLGR